MTREEDRKPTPPELMQVFVDWFDPCPLEAREPILSAEILQPPTGAPIFLNPPYSEKSKWIDQAIEWHKQGHKVALLIPIETSTQYAKKILQYGCLRLYFDKRIFPTVRGVELLILTG
jgi:hypothetical protein